MHRTTNLKIVVIVCWLLMGCCIYCSYVVCPILCLVSLYIFVHLFVYWLYSCYKMPWWWSPE